MSARFCKTPIGWVETLEALEPGESTDLSPQEMARRSLSALFPVLPPVLEIKKIEVKQPFPDQSYPQVRIPHRADTSPIGEKFRQYQDDEPF